PDSRVSRSHARIRLEGGVLSVSDLGSRNGTRINSRSIWSDDRRVFGGDVIHVGPLEVTVARIAKPAGRSDGAAELDGEIDGIVVADPATRKVFDVVRRLADTHTTVLILGETGSGKEVVAEQIHRWSARRDASFVRLNCARIPDAALEGDLF